MEVLCIYNILYYYKYYHICICIKIIYKNTYTYICIKIMAIAIRDQRKSHLKQVQKLLKKPRNKFNQSKEYYQPLLKDLRQKQREKHTTFWSKVFMSEVSAVTKSAVTPKVFSWNLSSLPVEHQESYFLTGSKQGKYKRVKISHKNLRKENTEGWQREFVQPDVKTYYKISGI